MKKVKKKPWQELLVDKCPKCGGDLGVDMLGLDLSGCPCGFVITNKTKKILNDREKHEQSI